MSAGLGKGGAGGGEKRGDGCFVGIVRGRAGRGTDLDRESIAIRFFFLTFLW